MMRFLAVVAIGASLAAPAAADESVEAGKAVFKKCMACHVVDKIQNKVGPHLNGIVGRVPASVEGYKYSAASLKHAQEKPAPWDETSLDAYLTDPKAYIPGNKMAFAGLKQEEDRKAVIAYLKSVPPVPAATQ